LAGPLYFLEPSAPAEAPLKESVSLHATARILLAENGVMITQMLPQ
jgi:hypothetical protein